MVRKLEEGDCPLPFEYCDVKGVRWKIASRMSTIFDAKASLEYDWDLHETIPKETLKDALEQLPPGRGYYYYNFKVPGLRGNTELLRWLIENQCVLTVPGR